MNNKKILKLIDIIFWAFIIILTSIEIINSIKQGNIKININDIKMLDFNKSLSLIAFIFFIAVFYTIVSLLKNFYITILYLGFRIANKRYTREKLDKIDLKNNNYYREIIKENSPAVLSYIDDFSLDSKDIVATIMSLELKNKVNIKDKIEVIDDLENNLDENEKYVLEKIKNNSFLNLNLKTFEEKVLIDCINKKLLVNKMDIKKKIVKKILLFIIFFIIIFSLFKISPYLINNIMKNDIIKLIALIIILIIFFIIIILPLTTISYIKSYYAMNKNNPYVRSDRGKNVNIKIKGLKKYIKEYSLLKEKKYQDITVWKEYLIYSVIFNMNQKIVNEILSKCKNEEKDS